MSSIRTLIGWGLLLSFALCGPVSLPAGGGSLNRNPIRRSEDAGTFYAGDFCELRSSPSTDAPSLRMIQTGTPIRVLRAWNDSQGNDWLHIQMASLEIVKDFDSVTRGWVNV
tara:strand:+ start:130 stop:465 length:336 start_codon:yes stop_codon:yes gene_type:complete